MSHIYIYTNSLCVLACMCVSVPIYQSCSWVPSTGTGTGTGTRMGTWVRVWLRALVPGYGYGYQPLGMGTGAGMKLG